MTVFPKFDTELNYVKKKKVSGRGYGGEGQREYIDNQLFKGLLQPWFHCSVKLEVGHQRDSMRAVTEKF